MPVPATRRPLVTIAIGMVAERDDVAARRAARVGEIAVDDPSVSSEISERMPLHASATSSVVFARMMTLPSRSTGMPTRLITDLAEPRGQQLQRKRDLVEDDRRNRNHQQQERQRERQDPQVLPARGRTGPTPASTPMIEMRVRNSSAPSRPATSTTRLPASDDQAERAGRDGQRGDARAGAPRRNTAPAERSGSRASSCRRHTSRGPVLRRHPCKESRSSGQAQLERGEEP